MPDIRRCEHRHVNEPETCGAPAAFSVSRGRKYDAQDSCRRHLTATVDALAEGQDVDITVRAVRANREGRLLAQALGLVLDEIDQSLVGRKPGRSGPG